mmetsp:Transcript_36954/g.111691  ORF Transcript_36954/g.111691 Transcript_36954/m.111691 type:complete len:294 (+) Transcript_36954:902-1783(+)
MRTTEPNKSSTSLGFPAHKSRLQLVVAPTACFSIATRFSSHASSYFKPWLRAKAIISPMALRHKPCNSGVLPITSCVATGPLTAPTAVVEQMNANFSHIFGMASSSRWPAMPGHCLKIAWSCWVFAVDGPSNSPKVMYGGSAAQCRIMPGSWIADTMLQQPANARPTPHEATMDRILSKPSTPFCNGSTSVFGPAQGRHIARQRSASHALQPSTITSASNTSAVLRCFAAGSPLPTALPRAPVSMRAPSWSGGTVASPQMLLIRTPCFFSAANAWLRAMKLTSCPCCASLAPK